MLEIRELSGDEERMLHVLIQIFAVLPIIAGGMSKKTFSEGLLHCIFSKYLKDAQEHF